MNDTIVIFDRIRERMRIDRRESLEKISNEAINETLSRTTITSGLTFLSVLALFIGIIIGTYSSIAIATPIMLWGRRLQAARNPVKE